MTTTSVNGRRAHQTPCQYKISGRCCKNVDLSSILCRNCTKDLSDDQKEIEEEMVAEKPSRGKDKNKGKNKGKSKESVKPKKSSSVVPLKKRGGKYKNNILLGIVKENFPSSSVAWKFVAQEYFESSSEISLRDYADVKRYFIQKMCKNNKKTTGEAELDPLTKKRSCQVMSLSERIVMVYSYYEINDHHR
jgi:hypothetical protein